MQVVTVGEEGQVSLPKDILERLGIKSQATMLVEVGTDGAIILRQADAYPIEIYSAERLEEFAEADRISEDERAALTAAKARKS